MKPATVYENLRECYEMALELSKKPGLSQNFHARAAAAYLVELKKYDEFARIK